MEYSEIKELNTLLANLAVMNINVHNLHWNVVGPHFKNIHKMTEKFYKMLQKQFDEVAEAMKMQQHQPLASLTDYLEKATLTELESRDYNNYEVVEELLNGYKNLSELTLQIRKKADKEDNFMIVNMMEDYLCSYAKINWMLKVINYEEDNNDDNLSEDDED